MHSGDTVTCNVTIATPAITKATDYTVVDTFYYYDATIPAIYPASQQKGLLMITIKNDNSALTLVPSTMFTTKGEKPNQ